MARRGTRLTRSGSTASASGYVTVPSGVTINTSKEIVATTISGLSSVTSTAFGGKVDFGQGTAYKIYTGIAPVSFNTPSGGTRLSNGTLCFTTGLTTITSFTYSLESSEVTIARAWLPHYHNAEMGYVNPGSGEAGVTIWLYSHDQDACTPCQDGTSMWSGVSLHWTAVGV